MFGCDHYRDKSIICQSVEPMVNNDNESGAKIISRVLKL